MKIHWLEIELRLHDVETSSWNELEVKIREALKNALGLEGMDAVELDFGDYTELEEGDER